MAVGKYKDIMVKNGQINAKILGFTYALKSKYNIVPRGKCPDIMLLLSKIFAHCNRKGIIAPKKIVPMHLLYIFQIIILSKTPLKVRLFMYLYSHTFFFRFGK